VVARCFQQSNGICVKTIVDESGDVYVHVANNKRKNPKVIFIHTKQIYFTGVSWTKYQLLKDNGEVVVDKFKSA